jgi:hypothetical protein
MDKLTPANGGTNDLDKQIAVTLCRMIDCLEFKGGFFGELGAEQIKHWIKSRAACYIAAREAGLLESESFKSFWN